MEIDKLKGKYIEFNKNTKLKNKIKEAWIRHKKFLKLYPFKQNPSKIEKLTEENVYNPGKEYFFYWIEHGLKALGGVGIGSDRVFRSARENLDKLKYLLKIIVDNSKTISQKIDADWESIKGFGGDKQIAKKILFCYYPDSVMPIFSTDHLKYYCDKLGLDFKKSSKNKFNRDYEGLSIGERFELFNEILLNFKSNIDFLRGVDNSYFMRFLYKLFPEVKSKPIGEEKYIISSTVLSVLLQKFKEGKISNEKMEKIITEMREGNSKFYDQFLLKILKKLGLKNIPYYHDEVVCLFGKLHKDLGFIEINEIQPKYPDAIVVDKDGKEKKIEFEVDSSDFNHDKEGCDFIVCFTNNLNEEKAIDLPPIISLEEFILKKYI